MLNFYRQFLPHTAVTQAPLHDVLSGLRVKGSHLITWTPNLHRSFEEFEATLSRATLLAHPDPAAPLTLLTDSATGAVLQQCVSNTWQPLAFFSKKLDPAQQKYNAYNQELLSVYEAVNYFHHMLEANHFIIFTVYKPITYAFQQKRDKSSLRQFNHLDFVTKFTTYMLHISGQDNIADTVSPVESVTAPPSHDSLATSQDSDEKLRTLWCQTPPRGLRSNKFPAPLYLSTATHLPGNFSRTFQLPYGSKCSSPSMICRTWAPACQACQRSKVSRHTVTTVGDLTLPAARFLHVHVDLMGPFQHQQATHTASLQLTASRTGKKPSSADTVACALLTGWISRFGSLQTITTTNQGRQFESQLFHSLGKLFEIQLSRTTAYHPAANRFVECFHRTLKAAIMCHVDQQWTETLPLVLLSIHTLFKAVLQASVAELMYGELLRIPGELLTPTDYPVEPVHLIRQLGQHMAHLRPVPAVHHTSSYPDHTLQSPHPLPHT
jgi:cleavage and polyadenylation specificity factor subunit 1